MGIAGSTFGKDCQTARMPIERSAMASTIQFASGVRATLFGRRWECDSEELRAFRGRNFGMD
jgi:hypothetical protein